MGQLEARRDESREETMNGSQMSDAEAMRALRSDEVVVRKLCHLLIGFETEVYVKRIIVFRDTLTRFLSGGM